MFFASAVLSLYTIYILYKLFSYKVVIYDEFMEIRNGGRQLKIRYDDIIDVKIEKDACYIIDKFSINRELIIRTTEPPVKYDPHKCEIIRVNTRKLSVLQKAYLADYKHLIDCILDKCRAGRMLEGAYDETDKFIDKSEFISAVLLKEINERQAGLNEILKTVFPYILLLVIFLMSLVEYGVWAKRVIPEDLIPFLTFVFPVFAVLTIYVLVLKYIPYIKELMYCQPQEINISKRVIAGFLMINIIISGGIIAIFFYILNSIAL